MSDSELAVVAPQNFQAPILIERAGASTRKKFFEFFTVPIRNANTRAAYYRAIQQFLAWAERAGYQDLDVVLYLNRRQWPFTALNSWTGSLSTPLQFVDGIAFKSWICLGACLRFKYSAEPKFRVKSVHELSAVVYDLSALVYCI
jgi:hypothetical protein